MNTTTSSAVNVPVNDSVIEKKLRRAFEPQVLEIKDTSHLHASHNAAAKKGGTHMHVVIVSKKFIGNALLQRHRQVYDALERELKGGLHALALKSYTPQEWRLQKENKS